MQPEPEPVLVLALALVLLLEVGVVAVVEIVLGFQKPEGSLHLGCGSQVTWRLVKMCEMMVSVEIAVIA